MTEAGQSPLITKSDFGREKFRQTWTSPGLNTQERMSPQLGNTRHAMEQSPIADSSSQNKQKHTDVQHNQPHPSRTQRFTQTMTSQFNSDQLTADTATLANGGRSRQPYQTQILQASVLNEQPTYPSPESQLPYNIYHGEAQ